MGEKVLYPKPFIFLGGVGPSKSLCGGLRRRPRTAQSGPEDKPDIVKMGSCVLDLAAHRLYDANGHETHLTNTEFDLLRAFAQHPDRVLSRQQLLNLAHNRSDQVFDRSVDLRILRLRRKIESNPDQPQMLQK